MFKCRASGSGKLVSEPKSIPKVLKGTPGELLSEGAKDAVRAQWISERYHRDQEFTSKAIQKGLANEEQGITMLSLHLGEMLVKNEKYQENEFIKGTADIIHEDTVFDIKCSYSIWTFAKADLTKDYLYQLQCYMELWGLKKAALVYVLTDTPMPIIQGEVKSICWKLQNDDDALEIEAGLIKEMTYSDIPAKDRIKIFEFEYDPQKIELLYKKVELCRSYYDSLKLNG